MKPAAAFRRNLIRSSLLFSSLMGSSAFALGARSHEVHRSTASLHAGKETARVEKTCQSPIPEKLGNLQPTSAKPAKKNPIDIFGIDHVVLLVDDLQGMAEWYKTVLGCHVAKHNEKFQMIHLDAGSALIDLVDRAGPLGNGGDGDSTSNTEVSAQKTLDHICLGLNDFDEAAIRDHLASHGVTITTEVGVRYGKGGYGESLYFSDPEGTRIEIKKTRLLE